MDSIEYMNFIMPTAEQLKEEEWFCSLSKTEQQLVVLRSEMMDGKIPRYDESDSSPHTCYEDVIGSTLFWARERGEITEEESDRLYKKYC